MNLRRVRRGQGLTQEQLVYAAGVSPAMVARIERGTRHPALDVPLSLPLLIAMQRPQATEVRGFKAWIAESRWCASTRSARRAGHGVEVFLRVYAGCIEGQTPLWNRRINDALHDDEDGERP